jgi:hypothetical protein
MSDEQAVQQTVPETAPGETPGGIKGFLGTTVGKIVVVGAAIGALAAVLGVVAFVLLTTFVSTAVDQLPAAPGGAATTPTVVSQATTMPGVPEIEARDVFTPRSPFEPVKAPESAFIDPNAPASSAGTGEDTLWLEGIVNLDGTLKAVLWFSDIQYTLAAGESVPNTNWKVTAVTTTSVTVQYGDEFQTLYPSGGAPTK